MRHGLVLCSFVAAVSVSLTASADDNDTRTAPAREAGNAVSVATDKVLSIHGNLGAEGASVAGRSRDVEMSATKTGPQKVTRPPTTPRTLRRMNADRAMAAIEPAVRACASDNPSATPVSLTFRVSVAPNGDLEGADPSAKLHPALMACVTRAVMTLRFTAPQGAGAAVVVPVAVPGRPVTPPPQAEAKNDEN